MRAFNKNLTFMAVDIDRLTQERPDLVQDTLRTIFRHFEQREFTLGPTRFFPVGGIHEAFQEMALSRHVGKILIDFSQGEIDIVESATISPAMKRDGCYIVTGGTSGFGAMTARWMAAQGAGKILLASRSGPNAPGVADIIGEIVSHGTQAEALPVDVTNEQDVRGLLAAANDGNFSLKGIVHGAMVLDDAMMADVTEESFLRVFRPKVLGALNIASALGESQGLDFLVFYSSVSALVGNRGQTSYVAANRFLDGLARVLRDRGIPATSINWGALAESGVVARDERLVSVLNSAGITGLTDAEALEALGRAIRSPKDQIGVFKVDWEKWHAANPKVSGDPRFRDLGNRSGDGDEGGASAMIRKDLADRSREQRLRVLEDHLQEVLAATLRMSKETISVNRKLSEMGVDSLMVLELGLGIRERLGVNFSAMEFLKGPNIQQLAEMAENKIWSNGNS
jgi:NAD(P)-dependent dehydrogenase (short-subunit alcohol dehydrogenase family)/acyl carrier protein